MFSLIFQVLTMVRGWELRDLSLGRNLNPKKIPDPDYGLVLNEITE